jgi:hypothetical protein
VAAFGQMLRVRETGQIRDELDVAEREGMLRAPVAASELRPRVPVAASAGIPHKPVAGREWMLGARAAASELMLSHAPVVATTGRILSRATVPGTGWGLGIGRQHSCELVWASVGGGTLHSREILRAGQGSHRFLGGPPRQPRGPVSCVAGQIARGGRHRESLLW